MYKIIYKFVILFSILFFSHQLFSQVSQEWVSRYSPLNPYDGPKCMVVDNAGFAYIGGSIIFGGRDMAVLKLTPAGDTAWVRKYNGTNNGGDYVFAIAIDNAGNVYITGRSDNAGTQSDFTTIKYNSAGVQQWVALYNGTANGIDEADAIVVDNAGNVFVAGKSPGTGTNLDIVTIKYNPAGVQQWVQRYDGTSHSTDLAYSIALTSTGEVVVAGTAVNTNRGFDFTVLKYSTAGALLWDNNYYNPLNLGGTDFARSVVIDNLDNVIAAGLTDNGVVLHQDYIVVKYNSAGVQQWVSFYNGPSNLDDDANDVDLDPAGNIYATGKSMGAGTGNDYATVKFNSAGVQQWASRYNGAGNGNDEAVAIEVDAAGNSYITGGSEGAAGDTNYVTIKYNTLGVQQWLAVYDGPVHGNDIAVALALNNLNYVYVTGESFGTGLNYDIATIKYFQCTLAVNAGNDTTITVGLGEPTVVLTANTAGGMPPIHYSWSTGDTTQSITVHPTVTTSYIVTALDSRGCSGTDTVVVFVINISCGNHKVLICHRGQTICVDSNAVHAHLNHGDVLGPCQSTDAAPKEVSLNNNYPNPFNPVTSISFELPDYSKVQLIIYDNLGREVSRLVDGYLEAGKHKYNWDANNFASGIYFYKLIAKGFEQTRKMVLIK